MLIFNPSEKLSTNDYEPWLTIINQINRLFGLTATRGVDGLPGLPGMPHVIDLCSKTWTIPAALPAIMGGGSALPGRCVAWLEWDGIMMTSLPWTVSLHLVLSCEVFSNFLMVFLWNFHVFSPISVDLLQFLPQKIAVFGLWTWDRGSPWFSPRVSPRRQAQVRLSQLHGPTPGRKTAGPKHQVGSLS